MSDTRERLPAAIPPHVPSEPAEGAEGAEPAEDGLALLEEVRAWFARYIMVMHDSDLDLLALWAAHTHCASALYTTPRLLIDSPVPGSGKTTVLEHLSHLSRRAVQMSTITSASMLARLLEHEQRTLLIDEADRSLRPDKEGTPDLLAIVNGGYKRGNTRPTNVPKPGGGWEVKELPTFAPVAMAGNNPALPDDTRSRTIRVLLLPDLHDTVAESDWEMIEHDADQLGARLARWGAWVADNLGPRPDLPASVKGRARECWQPLKRVAVMAGGRWPEAVDAMAALYVEQVAQDREDGLVQTKPAVVLLGNVAEVWPAGETFARTADLAADLAREFPEQWGHASPYGKALTVQRLGRMMSTSFSVNTARQDRANKTSPRGYHLAALVPVMERMGIPAPPVPHLPHLPPVHTPTPGHTGASTGGHEACATCGEPMTAVEPGQSTHPGCEEAT